jgi:predicted ATP-grasp superfamily ATP-dependent carboligase
METQTEMEFVNSVLAKVATWLKEEEFKEFASQAGKEQYVQSEKWYWNSLKKRKVAQVSDEESRIHKLKQKAGRLGGMALRKKRFEEVAQVTEEAANE